MTENTQQKSIWSALREPFFRMLWTANMLSLVGSWMHETGTAWLMTSMTVSPFMVAMLQTSMTLPFFSPCPAGRRPCRHNRQTEAPDRCAARHALCRPGSRCPDAGPDRDSRYDTCPYLRPWGGGSRQCPHLAIDHPRTRLARASPVGRHPGFVAFNVAASPDRSGRAAFALLGPASSSSSMDCRSWGHPRFAALEYSPGTDSAGGALPVP